MAIKVNNTTVIDDNRNISGLTLSGNLYNSLILNTSGTGLSGSTTYNNSNAVTFTVTSNATSSNTGSTLVARDASGNFTAGTITAATRFSGDGAIPAGTVMWFAATSAPTGFIKANGASLSTSTYAALFSAIGYTFGGGGSSFSVPDLRGEFIRGWDDSRGADSGRSFGSYQADQMQGHRHAVVYGTKDVLGGGVSAFWPVNMFADSVYKTDASYAGSFQDDGNGTPRTGAETRPRNRALLACIKF